MNSKTSKGVAIGIAIAFVGFALWYCGKRQDERRLVISLANFAQISLIQAADSPGGNDHMMMMRRADGELSLAVNKNRVMELVGGCCPCPQNPVTSCQCDQYGHVISEEYVALASWRPEVSMTSAADTTAGSAVKPIDNKDGTVSFAILKAGLPKGNNIIVIRAAFDGKNFRNYRIAFNVDSTGRPSWGSK